MKEASKRRRGTCAEEAAFLDLLRTTDMLSRALVQVLKTEDLSATQYNVLRILRGTPAGLTCGDIASRMITRDPDVTRLLDRLEKRGLISRWRATKDRRTVIAQIMPEGLTLLTRLDEPVQAVHRKQLGHLGRERLRTLAKLLSLSRNHGSELPRYREPADETISSRSAEIDGVKLHYMTAGHGTPLVPLHGYAEASRMWLA